MSKPFCTRVSSRLTAAVVQELESRLLMSAAPAPGDPRGDVAEKIDAEFYRVTQDVVRNGGAGNEMVRAGLARVDSKGRLESYIRMAGSPAGATEDMRRLGGVVTAVDAVAHVVQAWMPADRFDDLAALPEVLGVDAPTYAVSFGVTSAGDGLLNADKVRQRFAALGIDGTGIKIGVISDGADHAINVGAELSAVTVDPVNPHWNTAGNHDEGTAMLEIVHDLAPGAQLYASGPDTPAEMVASIQWMVAQGCDVIVDDLGFFDQSYFSDGSIANAAATAVSQGVVYVSAAGNSSQQGHYQGQYVSSGGVFGGGVLNFFGPSLDHDTVTIEAGQTFRAFLQWSDAPGFSANDYDLYLIDDDTFGTLKSGVKVQNGNDNPFESLAYTNSKNVQVKAQVWVVKKNGAAARELELFTLGNSSLAVSTAGDAIFGQQAVGSVITVAAANANNPGGVAAYSSHGPTTIYSNFSTQAKAPRQTLDGTAIDGVQTQAGLSAFFGANPFFGTSAAAPHAAAIAVLLKQINASLTPAQVAQVMADTAVDYAAYGAGYDAVSGAGRYDALAAAYAVFAPEKPDLQATSDSGKSNTDNVTNVNLPVFTGNAPAGSYVRLLIDGTQVAAVQLAAGATVYALTPGQAVADGDHAVFVRVAASAAVPLAQNSPFSDGLAIRVDTAAPAISSVAFNYDAPGQSLNYVIPNVLDAGLNVFSLVLTNLTTNAVIPTGNTGVSFPPGVTIGYTFPGYPYGRLPDGNYHAALVGVADQAGNALVANAGFDFFVYAGDANFDRAVDFNDLVVVGQHYNSGGGMKWSDGDFTGDGNVDFNDLVDLSQRYNTVLAAPGAPAVPVPPDAVAPVASAAVLLGTSKAGAGKGSLFNTVVRVAPAVVKRPVVRGRIRGVA